MGTNQTRITHFHQTAPLTGANKISYVIPFFSEADTPTICASQAQKCLIDMLIVLEIYITQGATIKSVVCNDNSVSRIIKGMRFSLLLSPLLYLAYMFPFSSVEREDDVRLTLSAAELLWLRARS